MTFFDSRFKISATTIHIHGKTTFVDARNSGFLYRHIFATVQKLLKLLKNGFIPSPSKSSAGGFRMIRCCDPYDKNDRLVYIICYDFLDRLSSRTRYSRYGKLSSCKFAFIRFRLAAETALSRVGGCRVRYTRARVLAFICSREAAAARQLSCVRPNDRRNAPRGNDFLFVSRDPRHAIIITIRK